MKGPKVSVIVPAFNSEATLEKCLDSLLVQDFKDFEIIIPYTPSSDRTKKIIKRFMQKEQRVRMVVQKKRGRGRARNSGIKASKGEVLAWTDSDCTVPKGWLKKLIRPILKSGASVVQGSENTASKNLIGRLTQHSIEVHMKAHELKGGYTTHIDTKNFAITRDALENAGGFNDHLKAVEDFELNVRLKKAGYKTRYLPKLRVEHNHRETLGGLVKQRFEQGYWVAVVYYIHKDFIDTIENRDNAVDVMFLSYFIRAPFRLIKYVFTYGVLNALFVTINSGSWIMGSFWGRMNRKRELAKKRTT